MSNSSHKEKFNTFLNNHLVKSCEIMHELALSCCQDSYISESCAWYHSSWQFLRMCDTVSSPLWHFDFYFESLSSKLNHESNILISGTADYSMLALIWYVSNIKDIRPNFYVCDLCQSPLKMCEYFADKTDFNVNLLNKDLFKLNGELKYDIIITDAFLTRFENSNKVNVLKKWNSLLKDDGQIITTTRIESDCIDAVRLANEKEIIEYSNNVKVIASDFYCETSEIDKVYKLSKEYIRNMKSYPFKSVNEIKFLIEEAGLIINYQNLNSVKGELHPSTYLQLVAMKK